MDTIPINRSLNTKINEFQIAETFFRYERLQSKINHMELDSLTYANPI